MTQKILNYYVTQIGADGLTPVTVNTTLSNDDDFVLSINRIEMEFNANSLTSWASAVDAYLTVAISNDTLLVYLLGLSKSVVASFSMVQHGTALAATDYGIDRLVMQWEPPVDFPVYLYNEQMIINLLSSGTGIINVASVRFYVDKVKVPAVFKTALRSQ